MVHNRKEVRRNKYAAGSDGLVTLLLVRSPSNRFQIGWHDCLNQQQSSRSPAVLGLPHCRAEAHADDRSCQSTQEVLRALRDLPSVCSLACPACAPQHAQHARCEPECKPLSSGCDRTCYLARGGDYILCNTELRVPHESWYKRPRTVAVQWRALCCLHAEADTTML